MTTTTKDNLKSLIKANKFNYVNSDITDKNFPTEPLRGEVKIYHFNRSISSEDAIAEMAKDGYEPATLYELLDWGKTVKYDGDWKYYVALGSVCMVGFGRCVPLLFVDGRGRFLDLNVWAFDWRALCRFAAVRKNAETLPSSTTPESLKTLNPSDQDLNDAIETVKKAGLTVSKIY